MLPEELEKLYNLYQQGAISESEYEEVKQRLLQRQPKSGSDKLLGLDVKGYTALLHGSQYANLVAPLAGMIVPIFLWLNGREVNPEIDRAGKHVVNWIISIVVYIVVLIAIAGGLMLMGGILSAVYRRSGAGMIGQMLVFVGYVSLYAGMGLIALIGSIFPLIGIMRSLRGETFQYPLALRFIK